MLRRIGGLVVALAIGLSGAVALATPAQATATQAAGCETITHTNLDGIETVKEPTVTLTNHGVRVKTTEFNDQGATWWQQLAEPVDPADVQHLSYKLRKIKDAVIPEAMPAYLLKVGLANGENATLVYEPYGNPNDGGDSNPPAAKQTKKWVVSDGVFWTTDTDVQGMTEYAANPHSGLSLADIAANNQGMTVLAFGWRQEWAEGLVAQVNAVRFKADGKCQVHHWTKPAKLPIPDVKFKDDCTGTQVLLFNAENATAPALFVIGKVHVNPLEPGFSSEEAGPAVVLNPEYGEITVTEKSTEMEWTHTWTEPKGGCDDGGQGGDKGDNGKDNEAGGKLPVTGSTVKLIAGAAIVLLLLGGGLYTVSRRRRLTFTAQ